MDNEDYRLVLVPTTAFIGDVEPDLLLVGSLSSTRFAITLILEWQRSRRPLASVKAHTAWWVGLRLKSEKGKALILVN